VTTDGEYSAQYFGDGVRAAGDRTTEPKRASRTNSGWYALRSKPNREDALWREARARGFEVVYPRIRVQPANPRARTIKPYFPGYMFVHTDVQAVGLSAFAWMPYSTGLVCYGADPAPVPELLVNAIRRRVGEVNAAGGELFDGLKRGDAVRIEAGPFAGCDALFDCRLSGSERVRVLLKVLNRQLVPLELPSGQIRQTTRH
jgi:transcription antitermination factor NusG